jgi:hypothetical protein
MSSLGLCRDDETIVVQAKPAPRAPRVLEQLEATRASLARLKTGIAELMLAVVEGRPSAKEVLASLHEKTKVATIWCDGLVEAYDLALRLDRDALAAWKASLAEMLPEQLIAGLTATRCCSLCTSDDGCVLSAGGPCLHPKHSVFPVALSDNIRLREAHTLATEKLRGARK